MGFRFIHAADIHLDSPLRGLSAYENAPVEQLRNATREALKELVNKAIEDKVSFVVFAGDLYDGDWRDYRTGIFFAAQMGRLAKAGIRAFILYGNHDAESEMTKKLVFPDNVVTFSSRSAQVHKIEDLKVALHGQSFANRAIEENLAANYKPKVNGHYNIGVLHTALEGYTAHPNYAPCTVDELHAKGYDYWALGHVHEFQQWDGPSTIVFPGNLQGRHVRETGRKGAVSVTVDDSGHSVVDRLYIDTLRWEVLSVDVGQCATFEDAAHKVGHELTGLLEADDVPRAVRVVLKGKTRLHGALFGNAAGVQALTGAFVLSVLFSVASWAMLYWDQVSGPVRFRGHGLLDHSDSVPYFWCYSAVTAVGFRQKRRYRALRARNQPDPLELPAWGLAWLVILTDLLAFSDAAGFVVVTLVLFG